MDSLDLHNVRHDEVARQLENFIYPHLAKGTNEVTIITGNSNEMKDIVRGVLKDYGMTPKEVWGNNGALSVALK